MIYKFNTTFMTMMAFLFFGGTIAAPTALNITR
jgi:hypothetical protein